MLIVETILQRIIVLMFILMNHYFKVEELDFGCEEEKNMWFSEETFWSINYIFVRGHVLIFWWTNCFLNY